MNEENWHLQQQDEGAYIPNKLPFYKDAHKAKESGAIKLKDASEKPTVGETMTSGHTQECMLVQLPGTLPWQHLEPHDGKALEQLTGSVGKLRVYKSGRVVMRFPTADGSHVDLEVNKGIQPGFY